jgi:hypothetical protein
VKDKCSFSFPPYGLNPKLSVANYFHPSITNHHKQQTTFSHQLIEAHFGRGVKSNKFCRKNAIEHDKGDPLDFMTTLSTTSKKFGRSPKNTPGFPTTVRLRTLQLERKHYQFDNSKAAIKR